MKKEFNFTKYVKENPLLKEWGAEDGPSPDDINTDSWDDDEEEPLRSPQDDDYDKAGRFWDLGGREIAKAVENLIDDGFTIEDIVKYIQEEM